MYSIGMTACELANGVVPFAHTPTTLMLTEKVRGCAPQLLDHSTLPSLYDDDGGQQSALHGTSLSASHISSGSLLFPSYKSLIIYLICKECRKFGAIICLKALLSY